MLLIWLKFCVWSVGAAAKTTWADSCSWKGREAMGKQTGAKWRTRYNWNKQIGWRGVKMEGNPTNLSLNTSE